MWQAMLSVATEISIGSHPPPGRLCSAAQKWHPQSSTQEGVAWVRGPHCGAAGCLHSRLLLCSQDEVFDSQKPHEGDALKNTLLVWISPSPGQQSQCLPILLRVIGGTGMSDPDPRAKCEGKGPCRLLRGPSGTSESSTL